MSIDSKLTQFCDYIEQTMGIPVFKMKRAFAPQMKNSFIVVGLNSVQGVPHDRIDLLYQNDDNNQLMERVRGLLTVEFLIQMYGTLALGTLSRLRSSFYASQFFVWGQQNGFGFVGSTDIVDISSTLLSSSYEERAQLTANFQINCPEEYDVDFFTKQHLSVITKGTTYEQDVPRES